MWGWLKRKFHSQRLFIKLILLYSILILLISSIMAVFFYTYHRKTFETVSRGYNAETLSQIQHNIENNLQQIEQLSMILVSNNTVQKYLRIAGNPADPDLYDTSKEVERLAIDVMVSRNDIESICLYPNAGDSISTSYAGVVSENFDTIYAAASPLQGKLVWLYLDAPAVVAARIVYDAQSLVPAGLLVVQYRPNALGNIVNGADTTNFLLDTDNQVIVAPAGEGLTLDIAQLTAIESGEFTKISLAGKPYVTTLVTSGYNGWQYISATPEALLNINTRDLAVLLLVTLLVAVLVGVAFSVVIAWEITKPLQRLTYHLQDSAIGQLPRPKEAGKDEFSYLFASYNNMLGHIEQLIAQNYEQRLLQNEMELKILHMQINPHFLYNALDTVYYVALDANQTQIAQIVEALAQMMRYSLSGGGSHIAKVQEEMQHAENYCIVQKIRMGSKIEYYFDIVDELLEQPLPRLTLQPFVENAVKHGWQHGLEHPLFVEVIGYIADGCCVFEIRDDGVGISAQQAESLRKRMETANFSAVHGVAVPNINAQLKGAFGEAYGVSFLPKNEYGGATFIIKTPYKAG